MISSLRKLRHTIRWKLAWYAKSVEISHPPYYWNVEPTNCCNLRCSICSLDDSRPKGYMDWELYKRLIDQARKMRVTEIRLFLAGEPLLHKDIAAMVSHANTNGLRTCIHTNATRLTRDLSRELIKAGLTDISFSFDGETKEEYERVRVGADFDRTLSNIIEFLHTKKELGSKRPHAVLQVIKPFDPRNPAPLSLSADFVRRFSKLPLNGFSVFYPHTWAGEKTDIASRPRGACYFPCQTLWQSMSVAWDGRVLLCCGDLNGRVVLGDLKTQDPEQIWLGKRMRDLRRALVERRSDSCPLCNGCDALWRRTHPLVSDVVNLQFTRQLRGLIGRITAKPGKAQRD